MNCDQVRDLLPAYAVDAVEEEEREAIEAHLAGCSLHAEAVELRAVAIGLAALAEEREPPAALEQRIMASIGRDASARASVAGTPGTAGDPVLPQRRPWFALAAAAVFLVAVGFAGGVLLFSQDLLRDEAAPAFVYLHRDGGAAMRVEQAHGSDAVLVTMWGLEARPAGESYQLWALRDERWVSVGVCNTDEDGWWRGDFDFVARESDRFVLTIEPTQGSTRPTGPAVIGSQD